MLGKNIKDLRVEQGLTQANLAEKIGVTQGAVFFWEKGINEPTAGYLIKMAEIFNVSVDELLDYNNRTKVQIGKNKQAEMNGLFLELSASQQEILLSIAKEFLKAK